MEYSVDWGVFYADLDCLFILLLSPCIYISLRATVGLTLLAASWQGRFTLMGWILPVPVYRFGKLESLLFSKGFIEHSGTKCSEVGKILKKLFLVTLSRHFH